MSNHDFQRAGSNVQRNIEQHNRQVITKIMAKFSLFCQVTIFIPLVIFISLYGIESKCDESLNEVLFAYMILHFVGILSTFYRMKNNIFTEGQLSEHPTIKRIESITTIGTLICFVLLNIYYFRSNNCAEVSPEASNFSFGLIMYGYSQIGLICLLPCLLISCLPCVFFLAINLDDNSQGGSKEQIKEIGSMQYNSKSVVHDHQKSCCICMEEFTRADHIRLLPCTHNYHKDCIDKWLGRNFSCPECRTKPDQRV